MVRYLIKQYTTQSGLFRPKFLTIFCDKFGTVRDRMSVSINHQ